MLRYVSASSYREVIQHRRVCAHTHLWKKHTPPQDAGCVCSAADVQLLKRLPSDTSGPRLSLPLCLSARYSQSHYIARNGPRSSLPRADANTLIWHLKRQKRRGADTRSCGYTVVRSIAGEEQTGLCRKCAGPTKHCRRICVVRGLGLDQCWSNDT